MEEYRVWFKFRNATNTEGIVVNRLNVRLSTVQSGNVKSSFRLRYFKIVKRYKFKTPGRNAWPGIPEQLAIPPATVPESPEPPGITEPPLAPAEYLAIAPDILEAGL